MTNPYKPTNHHRRKSEIERRRFLAAGGRALLAGAATAGLVRIGRADDPSLFATQRDYQQGQEFMALAIRLSRKAIALGEGGPFGAVIVKDGQVVGQGWNQIVSNDDPTAHGEVMAIRNACRFLGTYQLTGCEIYSSAEPCPMCLGAIYWSRLERVFYGNSIQDATKVGFDDEFIYEQLAKPIDQRAIPEHQMMRDQAYTVFKAYANDPRRLRY